MTEILFKVPVPFRTLTVSFVCGVARITVIGEEVICGSGAVTTIIKVKVIVWRVCYLVPHCGINVGPDRCVVTWIAGCKLPKQAASALT